MLAVLRDTESEINSTLLGGIRPENEHLERELTKGSRRAIPPASETRSTAGGNRLSDYSSGMGWYTNEGGGLSEDYGTYTSRAIMYLLQINRKIMVLICSSRFQLKCGVSCAQKCDHSHHSPDSRSASPDTLVQLVLHLPLSSSHLLLYVLLAQLTRAGNFLE